MSPETVLATFKDASKKLTGYRKRDFMASVTEDYLDGSARKAETVRALAISSHISSRFNGLRRYSPCVASVMNHKS